MVNHPLHPDWQGRREYWEPFAWTRTPERDVAIGLFRRKHTDGWNNYWYMLFHRFGDEEVTYVPVLSQSILTSPTGSNQTTTAGIDATWNNNANTIEVIGAGAAGAHGASTSTGGGGGGGGAYNSISNFPINNPGTDTFTWRIGAPGLHGGTFPQNGGDTWFNATAFPASGTAVGARGGASPATNSSATGGAGGLASNGFPTASPPARNGGTAANGTSATAGGGGGGAGGPNGVGGNGSGTTGGTGDGGTVSGGSPGNPGTCNVGTEWTTAGVSSGAGGSNASGGTGGNGKQAGGGAGGGSRSNGTGGDGGAGIIVISWTPSPAVTSNFVQRAPLIVRSTDPAAKARVDDFVNMAAFTLPPPPPLVTGGTIFRAPLFTKPKVIRPVANQEFVANRLPLTAIPVVTIIFNQDDWTTVVTPRPKAVSEPIIPVAPLLTPNPPIPFNQDLWEGAALPLAKAIGEPVAPVAPILTPNPIQPFNQYEWRSTARVPISLKSDSYFGAFPLYSPNPPIPFNQDLWENATRGFPKATGEAVAGTAPLLTPNPSIPFNQDIWDSATRGFPKATGEATAGVAPLLTPNPSVPFNQDLWENAAQPRPKAVGEAVAGPQPTPVVQPPFFQNDWYQIRSVQKARVDEPYNLTIYLPVVVVTVVFNQDDWPNPTIARPKIGGDFSLAGPSPLYTPNPSVPFNQDLWDLATRGSPKAIGEAVGTLSPLLTPNPAQPFKQNLWDSATRAFPKAYAEPFAAISALYSPNPFAPFKQSLWENATRAFPKPVGEPISGIAPLLTPNPAQPFAQMDWPSAVRAAPAAKVDTVELLLPIYSPPIPFKNSTETRTFAFQTIKSDIHVNLLPIQTSVGVPFSQRDWYNPTPSRQKVNVLHFRTITPGTVPPPPAAPPFFQSDWPLPHHVTPFDHSFIYYSQFLKPFVPPTLAQYFLLQPHVINDAFIPAWTVVTEGIEIPMGWVPTLAVDPLNQPAVDAFYAAGPRTGSPGPEWNWQNWQFLTAQRSAVIQPSVTHWVSAGIGKYKLTGLGAALDPIGE